MSVKLTDHFADLPENRELLENLLRLAGGDQARLEAAMAVSMDEHGRVVLKHLVAVLELQNRSNVPGMRLH